MVILGACHAGAWGFTVFNPSGAVATIGWDQPLSEANSCSSLINEIPVLLSTMTGNRMSGKTASINYSIKEIKDAGKKVLDTLSVWIRKGSDGNYVLYQQPRIDGVEVKVRKKGSIGTFDRLIYKYSYSGKNKFNPVEEYPGSESLEKAHKGFIRKDDELHVTLDFSKEILVEKQSDSIERTDTSGYLFRLCKHNNNNISNDECIDIEDNSLISFNYDLDKNNKPTDNLSNSSTKVTFRFDLTDFEKKKISLGPQTRLYLVAKAIDSYGSDGMYFLDTNGSGREDGMTSAVVDGPRNYEDSDTNPRDGLDTHHWFWVAPGVEVKRAQVYKLHLPMVFEGEEPPDKANLQPLRSDGVIPLDWKKIGYLYSRCVALPPWEKVSCTMDATSQAMKKLLPTYYLGPEILSAFALSAPILNPACASVTAPFVTAASAASSPPASEPIEIEVFCS